MSKKALVIASGGIDSSTLIAYLINEGYKLEALTFVYGQRNAVEVKFLKDFIKDYQIESHKIINLDFREIGGSSLTSETEVPKDQYDPKSAPDDIPVTYVPARNTIFLSYALAWAEVKKINNIFFGAHIYDYSNYPDCRPEYIEAFEKMANLGTEMGVTGKKISINAPFVKMSKSDIVEIGIKLGVDYSNTISCYDPNHKNESCGHCDACIIRLEAFAKNKLKDPVKYA